MEQKKENGQVKEVVVEAVRSTGLLGEAVMILREKEGKRAVLIWIGPNEASSISIAVERMPFPRPLTHDLFVMLFGRLGVKMKSVTITGLALGTYFATLAFDTGKETIEFDARPSDAVALAVRSGAPIFAAEELFAVQGEENDERAMV